MYTEKLSRKSKGSKQKRGINPCLGFAFFHNIVLKANIHDDRGEILKKKLGILKKVEA
jgi:hypothetical protein